MAQINIELALQLALQIAAMVWAVGKVNTKIAVLQTEIRFIKKALKIGDSGVADLS